MRKFVWVIGLLLLVAVPAMAQDQPVAEVAGGYSFLHVSVSGTLGGTNGTLSANGNGGSGSVAFNLNKWFGVVGDFGGYKISKTISGGIAGTGNKATADATLISYMFGPRLSYRENSNWTPFAQALFGGAHGTVNSASFNGVAAPAGSLPPGKNVFGFTLGGGLDYNFGKQFAVRLIQAEYYYTNFNAGKNSNAMNKINHQNNVRLTFGLVWRIGAK